MDLVETRAKKWETTKWPFATITNVACALLQIITMDCIDRVLPDQLLKHKNVYFPYQMVLEKSKMIFFLSKEDCYSAL